MEKSSDKPGPEKFDEKAIPPRDDVHVHGAGLRCPFCHDAVDVDTVVRWVAWVACERCLARHHEACWKEAGRCGGCGHDVALAGRLRPRVEASSRSLPLALWLALAVVGLLVLGTLVAGALFYARLNAQQSAMQRAEAMARLQAQQDETRWRFEEDRVAGGPRRIEVEDGYTIVDARGDWIFVDTRGGTPRVGTAGIGTAFVRADAEAVACRSPLGSDRSITRHVLHVGNLVVFGDDATRDVVANSEERAALLAALAAPPRELDIAGLLMKLGYAQDR